MNITRYEPGNLFNRLQDDINKIFKSSAWMGWPDESSVATAQWAPSVDIQEKDDQFLINADIPGVKPEEVEVKMENGALTIQGERTSEQRKEENGYRRVECAYGSFYRRFALPDTADANKIQAKAKNGVLEITIGKREASRPKAIKVQA
jgi:HSP20 family protein